MIFEAKSKAPSAASPCASRHLYHLCALGAYNLSRKSQSHCQTCSQMRSSLVLDIKSMESVVDLKCIFETQWWAQMTTKQYYRGTIPFPSA